MSTTAPAAAENDRRPASGRGPMALLRILRSPEWGLAIAIAAALLIIYRLDPSHAFFRGYRVQTLFHQVALFGLLAVGAAIVIISGGIDLSAGSLVALSSVIGAKLVTEWLNRGASPGSVPSTAIIATAMALTLRWGWGSGCSTRS